MPASVYIRLADQLVPGGDHLPDRERRLRGRGRKPGREQSGVLAWRERDAGGRSGSTRRRIRSAGGNGVQRPAPTRGLREQVARSGSRRPPDAYRPRPAAVLVRNPEAARELPPQIDHPRESSDRPPAETEVALVGNRR